MPQTVVKVGGSLLAGGALPELCRALAAMGRRHPLLVVPGGGPFADAVRRCHALVPVSESVAHWMAIAGMDQYGLLLAGLIPGAQSVDTLESARCATNAGQVAVLAPSALCRRLDALPHSWEVTSDSIAAWVSLSAGAKLCVLLKDRPYLYDADPRTDANARPQARITLEALAACRGVDGHLPRLLAGVALGRQRGGLECWTVDGRRPERLEALLATGQTEGTRIVAGADSGP